METASNSRPKRPLAVTILTWVLVIGALLNLATGILSLLAFTLELQGGTIMILQDEDEQEIFTDEGQYLFEGIWYTFVGVVQLVITIGFWRERRWAWVAAMTLQALSLLIDVANGLTGNPEIISLVTSILLVLLLNQSDVRRVFGIRRDSNEPAPTPTLHSLDSH